MTETPPLLAGKTGLVMGIANERSLAWGIARAAARHGARLAVTFQGEALEKRVRPLAEKLQAPLVLPADVTDPDSLEALFQAMGEGFGRLDFLVHAIAFSDKEELKGRYLDTTAENFARTMQISCYSFTELARRALPLMGEGGSLLTLTYAGAERVMPHYNVMGVAKAALEASVRYLALDFGERGIRVNAISAGPVRTLAGSGITGAKTMYNYQKRFSPLRKSVTLDEIGGAALYLLSDLSGGVTGEVHFVDAGYHIMSMPRPEEVRSADDNDVAGRLGQPEAAQ